MNKITKTVLEKLLNFLNANLMEVPERDFTALLGDYTYFVTHKGEKYEGIIDYPLKSWSYNKRITVATTSDTLVERREFFLKIQTHLKGKVMTVIDNFDVAENSDNSGKPYAPQRFDLYPGVPGKLYLSIDIEQNDATGVFVPNGIKETEEFDLVTEKRLADLALIDLLTEYDLKPNQIKRCVNCGKIFLQKTLSEKIYCSGTCGQAYRRRQASE